METKPLTIRDPIIYALKAFSIHWKQLLWTDLLFSIPFYICLLLTFKKKPLYPFYITNIPTTLAIMALALCLTFLSIFITTAWFPAAYTKLSLALYDGAPFKLAHIWSSLSYAGTIIRTAFIILFCFTLLLLANLIALYASPHIPFLVFIIILFSLLISIWLLIRISLSTFFIVDSNYGATKSILASYYVTRHKCWLIAGVKTVINLIAALVTALIALCVSILISSIDSSNEKIEIFLYALDMQFFFFIGYSLQSLADVYIYRALYHTLSTYHKQLNTTLN